MQNAAIKSKFALGERCQVGEFDMEGTIMYLGPFGEDSRQGGQLWVGVALDDKAGHHDGEAGGKRYFQCAGFSFSFSFFYFFFLLFSLYFVVLCFATLRWSVPRWFRQRKCRLP